MKTKFSHKDIIYNYIVFWSILIGVSFENLCSHVGSCWVRIPYLHLCFIALTISDMIPWGVQRWKYPLLFMDAFWFVGTFIVSVGRRSSVLKVKPSPVVYEVTSMKRARSAPRTGAAKRKVLMDDTMVLHGEYVPLLSAIVH